MEKFQEATMGYGGYHYAKKDGHIYRMVILVESTYTIENPDIRHRWMLQRFSESLGPCQEPLAQGPFLSIRTDCVCRSWNGDRRWRQQVLQKRIFRKTKWCKTTLFLQSGRKILSIWDMTNHLPSYLKLQPTHVCLWSKYNSVFKVCPNSGQMKHGFQAALLLLG